jgi:hypothetical protein
MIRRQRLQLTPVHAGKLVTRVCVVNKVVTVR